MFIPYFANAQAWRGQNAEAFLNTDILVSEYTERNLQSEQRAHDSILEANLPKWRNLIIAGPESPEYNCIALSIGRTDCVLDPAETLEAADVFYRCFGYSVCQQKGAAVAVFADGEIPQHAAVCLGNGMYESKLGAWELVIHKLSDFIGTPYGQVARFYSKDDAPAEARVAYCLKALKEAQKNSAAAAESILGVLMEAALVGNDVAFQTLKAVADSTLEPFGVDVWKKLAGKLRETDVSKTPEGLEGINIPESGFMSLSAEHAEAMLKGLGYTEINNLDWMKLLLRSTLKKAGIQGFTSDNQLHILSGHQLENGKELAAFAYDAKGTPHLYIHISLLIKHTKELPEGERILNRSIRPVLRKAMTREQLASPRGKLTLAGADCSEVLTGLR